MASTLNIADVESLVLRSQTQLNRWFDATPSPSLDQIATSTLTQFPFLNSKFKIQNFSHPTPAFGGNICCISKKTGTSL